MVIDNRASSLLVNLALTGFVLLANKELCRRGATTTANRRSCIARSRHLLLLGMDGGGLLWLLAHSTQSIFHWDHARVLLLLLVLDYICSLNRSIVEDGRASSRSRRPTIEMRLRGEANTGLRPASFHNSRGLGLFTSPDTPREAITSRARHLLMRLTWAS